MTRTKFAIKNTAVGILSKATALILGFVSRTVFIHFLGNEYLGVNGLYTEVLSILSFAELGFGTALTYAMYKPVAQNDTDTILKLTNYYKKIYRLIACIVAGLGLSILPFLQHVVKGADLLTLHDLRLYYVIFLFNTVTSYFVTYKYSIVNAHQKNYIITNMEMIVQFVTSSIQIIFLVVFKSFLIYLLTQSILLLCSRFFISRYLNKRFPILAQKSNLVLSNQEKAPIIQNVKGLIVHQFASVAVHSTDNIIISSFCGVIVVGLISNYTLLINSVLAFVVILFNSVTSGFGNMVASSSTENYRKTFLELNFLNFWIYGFCCIAFFILIPPFITFWIGKENLIDTASFLLIIINCYLVGQSTAYNNTRIAKGDFSRDKWIAFSQAVVNLIVSIICAKTFGLIGVYMGTIVSRMVFVIWRPRSTYRFLFERSCLEYYIRLAVYFAAVVCAGGITYLCTQPILKQLTFGHFLLSCGAVALLPNLLFLIVFHRTKEFRDLLHRVKGIVTERKNDK
jgi:hypothetical protein